MCEKERDDAFRASDAKCFVSVANTRDRVRDFPTFFYHRPQSRLQNASDTVLELQNEPENSKCGFVATSFEPFLVGMGEMGAQEECRMSLCRRE